MGIIKKYDCYFLSHYPSRELLCDPCSIKLVIHVTPNPPTHLMKQEMRTTVSLVLQLEFPHHIVLCVGRWEVTVLQAYHFNWVRFSKTFGVCQIVVARGYAVNVWNYRRMDRQ